MRISTATERRKFLPSESSEKNGFSLVELMIVIFLIGLVSAAVVLSLSGAGSKTRSDAERLGARMAAARDSAILESRPLAIWVSASGYGFERRNGDEWAQLDAKPFETTNWSQGVSFSGSGRSAARVVFDATGLPSSPLQIDLTHADGASTRVSLAASGEVSVGK